MRKIVTGIVLLAFIALWIVIAATIGTQITSAPHWAQLIFYILAGIAWVFPLRPLMRWMNSRPS